MAAGGQLGALLGVFQKLLASKALDHEGFAVLAALMARLPQPDFDRHLPTIWQLLFQRCGAGAHVERASRRFNMPSTLITIQHDGTLDHYSNKSTKSSRSITVYVICRNRHQHVRRGINVTLPDVLPCTATVIWHTEV